MCAPWMSAPALLQTGPKEVSELIPAQAIAQFIAGDGLHTCLTTPARWVPSLRHSADATEGRRACVRALHATNHRHQGRAAVVHSTHSTHRPSDSGLTRPRGPGPWARPPVEPKNHIGGVTRKRESYMCV